jgi:hypothetical protein
MCIRVTLRVQGCVWLPHAFPVRDGAFGFSLIVSLLMLSRVEVTPPAVMCGDAPV